MRFLFLALLLMIFMAYAAAAQTPITKETANNFYSACRSQSHPVMKTENLDAMCACNAAHMLEHMSVEEVQIMKEQSQAGRDMLNKMVIEVYTPCMNFPVYDLVEAECLNNPNLDMAGLVIPKEEICSCTAEKTAGWFAKEGREIMRIILKAEPNIHDPIEPLMNSTAFKTESYKSMTACLRGGN